jgi:hypothetical protein
LLSSARFSPKPRKKRKGGAKSGKVGQMQSKREKGAYFVSGFFVPKKNNGKWRPIWPVCGFCGYSREGV